MTGSSARIQARDVTAIDVHVHLEAPQQDGTAADLAARKYFGDSGAEWRRPDASRCAPLTPAATPSPGSALS